MCGTPPPPPGGVDRAAHDAERGRAGGTPSFPTHRTDTLRRYHFGKVRGPYVCYKGPHTGSQEVYRTSCDRNPRKANSRQRGVYEQALHVVVLLYTQTTSKELCTATRTGASTSTRTIADRSSVVATCIPFAEGELFWLCAGLPIYLHCAVRALGWQC